MAGDFAAVDLQRGWKENSEFDATAFRWNHLLLAGNPASERSDPADRAKFGNRPDFKPGRQPRSATVVMHKLDGGVTGT